MERYETLSLRLRGLTVFRGLLRDSVVSALVSLLETEDGSLREAVSRYGEFVSALYRWETDLGKYLLDAVLGDENRYVLRRAQNLPIDPLVEACADQELSVLQEAASLKSGELKRAIGWEGFLPEWRNTVPDFRSVYRQRMEELPTHGYGIYAKHTVFLLKNGAVTPVRHPDGIRVDQLSGYERERQQVIDNTAALLLGRPAANLLLYGDAGTGKSSTVKAVCNLFRDKGLRLIEIKKDQLHEIPALMDALGKNPLRFVLFIDDLSFARDDDNFSALKAVLEGTVAARSGNTVIYATSNRRHLVKESFSDRQGDDVHVNDTMQELYSLSDRFGLTITFQRPGKKQYMSIVRDLAEQYGVSLPEEALFARADAYALRRAGYSPRVAKQFIESLQAAQ